MARLAITLACGDYDRTPALADGRVTVEGADLTVLGLLRAGLAVLRRQAERVSL